MNVQSITKTSFSKLSNVLADKLHKIRNMLTHRIRNRIKFSRIWFLIQMRITHIKHSFNCISQIFLKSGHIGLIVPTCRSLH